MSRFDPFEIEEMIQAVTRNPANHTEMNYVESETGESYFALTCIVPAGQLAAMFPGFNWRDYVSEVELVASGYMVESGDPEKIDAITMLSACKSRAVWNDEDFPPWNQAVYEAQKIANAERQARADAEDGTPDTQEPIDYDE